MLMLKTFASVCKTVYVIEKPAELFQRFGGKEFGGNWLAETEEG